MNHDEFMRRFCNSLRSPTSGARVSKTSSFLRAERWNGPLLQAFKHFVAEHVRFDSDPDQGHGALSRHLKPDDRILPLGAFKQLLLQAVPTLATRAKVRELQPT
jgi:hypothetical protein